MYACFENPHKKHGRNISSVSDLSVVNKPYNATTPFLTIYIDCSHFCTRISKSQIITEQDISSLSNLSVVNKPNNVTTPFVT